MTIKPWGYLNEGERELVLTYVDPDWKERFPDTDTAADFYENEVLNKETIKEALG